MIVVDLSTAYDSAFIAYDSDIAFAVKRLL